MYESYELTTIYSLFVQVEYLNHFCYFHPVSLRKSCYKQYTHPGQTFLVSPDLA